MKKLTLYLLALIIVGGGCFYGGFRVGELNGRIEVAAPNTVPLLNMLLSKAGMEKELREMNRDQLYSHLTTFEALRSSWFVTSTNKKWMKENILMARDYWTATGGEILQTEEEAKKMRQQVESIRSATGVQMGMTMNGVQVSPFYFEEEDRRVRDLFSRYSGETSTLNSMIVEMVKKAKTEPNKTTTDNLRGVAPAVSEP